MLKCPRCGKENPDGVRYCTGCGLPLVPETPPFVPPQKNSRGFKIGKALANTVKVFCYVLLMLGVQYIVSSIYASYALLSDSTLLYSFNYEDVAQRIAELLLQNVTMLTLIANLLTILILSLFFALRRKNLAAEAMVRPVPKKILPLCMLYGTALNIFFSVTLSYLPLPPELFEALDDQYASLYGQTNLFVEILNTAVVTGIVEELIFRGLSLTRLKRAFSRGAAVAVSAVIFGIFHGALLAIGYATVLGVIFGLLAERYQSIVPTIVCHIFFNLTSFWFVTESPLLIFSVYFAAIAVLVGGSYLLFRRQGERNT